MWKFIYGCVRGTSHSVSGQPCQDYCASTTIGSTIVAACSDGAGSADLSHLGSKIAVERFLEVASVFESPPEQTAVESWVDAARERVIEEAAAQSVIPRQLACTLLVAIVGSEWAAFAQIGDGVMIFNGDTGYELVFWPDNGEYANTTRFLTDDDYRNHLRIDIILRNINDIAVMTDGLQMLALDFKGSRVHDRFIEPLFRTIRSNTDADSLQKSLLDFMDSDRVNDRTDDDKTLFLATRNNTDDTPIDPKPTT